MYYFLEEAKGSILPFTLEKVRITVIQFLICHLLITITGLVGVVVSYVITNGDPNIDLLEGLQEYNTSCFYFMHATSILLALTGIIGLMAHILGYPGMIMYSLSYLLMTPLGLTVIAIGESAGVTLRNSQGALHRIESLESNYYNRRDILQGLGNEIVFLGKFQERLQCCGVTDNRDWLVSTCNCMPTTCCRSSNMGECNATFVEGDSLKKLGYDFKTYQDKYQPLIWDSKCLDKIQSTIGNLKMKWIALPVIYLILQSVLSTWSFHVNFMLSELLETIEGMAQLQVYKAKWPSKNIKVKQKYKILTRATEEMRIPLSSSSSDPQEVFETVEEDIRKRAHASIMDEETELAILKSKQRSHHVEDVVYDYEY